MQVATVAMERRDARQVYEQYRKSLPDLTQDDRAAMKAAYAIFRRRTVIDLIATIDRAGRYHSGLPRLAIAPADRQRVSCECSRNGILFFFDAGPPMVIRTSHHIDTPVTGRAVVPVVPPQLRPRTLRRYHVLWEAEWQSVPVDPMLLRRIDKSNLYVVLATWNLTPIEQAVLRHRV